MPGDYTLLRQTRSVPIAAPAGVSEAKLTVTGAAPEPWASVTLRMRPTVRARRQMLHTLATFALPFTAHDTGGAWHVCVRGPHRLLEKLTRRPGVLEAIYGPGEPGRKF